MDTENKKSIMVHWNGNLITCTGCENGLYLFDTDAPGNHRVTEDCKKECHQSIHYQLFYAYHNFQQQGILHIEINQRRKQGKKDTTNHNMGKHCVFQNPHKVQLPKELKHHH